MIKIKGREWSVEKRTYCAWRLLIWPINTVAFHPFVLVNISMFLSAQWAANIVDVCLKFCLQINDVTINRGIVYGESSSWRLE